MSVIFSHMVSIDGYIETPESYTGPNWATTDDELLAHFLEAERDIAAHVYGRRVYEQVAAWWPRAAADPSLPPSLSAYGQEWVRKPKVVVSRTLSESALGPNTRLIRTDPEQVVVELSAEAAGDVTVYGGALAATLWRRALIEEVRCYVNPVSLGGGTPMFQDIEPVLRFRLLEARPFTCGVVLLRYGATAGNI